MAPSFLEEAARADLYSCDFEAPWTLWMHPSAVAHVYCTYPAGLNAAYESWDEWGNLVDSSAGTLVDYSGQGCPGDATVVAMDDGTIRTAVAAWLANAAMREWAEATYGHISTWETSGVTDMSQLFCVRHDWMEGDSDKDDCVLSTSSFDEDIGAWDTSGVTRMYGMFWGALAFNQDISGWAVQSVTSMSNMFTSASSFDQDLGGWSVENVRDMHYMFHYASAFDQDLGWCVDNDVNLDEAFSYSGCESTSCGVTQVEGDCAPSPAPTITAPPARSPPYPRRPITGGPAPWAPATQMNNIGSVTCPRARRASRPATRRATTPWPGR